MDESMQMVDNVPLVAIIPGSNDRKVFEPNALADLAASIKAHGLAQPITVRPILGSMYQIVAGERRFRAVQSLGWATIPALIRPLSDEEAAAIMLAENTGRVDLNPIEEATAYQKRIDAQGWDIPHIAEVAGVSPELVSRRISLLRLVDDVKLLVASGQMPIGHAEAMVDLDHNRQMIAARVYGQSSNMPLHVFRGMVNDLLLQQSQDSLFNLENFWTQVATHQREVPRRGKHAVTGAPIRSDLPPIEIKNDDTVGQVVDRYIAQLVKAGMTIEASTIGTLYDVLVHHNFVATPTQSVLLAAAEAAEATPA